MKKEFECKKCDIKFQPDYYEDNPVFLADKISWCPICGGKCWETEESKANS